MTQRAYFLKPMKAPRLATLLAVALFLSFTALQTPLIHAQTLGTGSISGTVQDEMGAVVAGAVVTVTNLGTNGKTSATASASGAYTIPNLPPGDYTVDVKAPGFASLEQRVHVEQLAEVGLNIKLKVGAETEKVTVSADEQPMLNTVNGQVETTVPAETYDDLPVGMGGGTKSPIAYITLTPGVTNNGTASIGSLDYVFNGGPEASSQLYVNGIPLPSSEFQGGWENLSSVMTAEIESFTVLTSGVPAYYDGQGIANMLYKSGTNKFHGDIFENVRNTVFDAAPFFNSGKRSPEHQNEYGIAAGGPIKRDRAWFFGSFDHFKITSSSSPFFVTVPTTMEQQGDFSGGNQMIFDPLTTTCSGGVCTRQQFPGNKIPASRFSNVANKLESFGLPQVSGQLTNNYGGIFPSGSQQWTEMGKTDVNLTKNNRLSILVQYDRLAPLATVQAIPEPYGSNRPSSNSEWMGQLNDTQTISPTLVNIFALGFTRNNSNNVNASQGGNWSTKAGITGLPTGSDLQGQFPMVTFAGGNATPTGWDVGASPFAEIPYSELVQDNIQWIKGKHAFTFGGQLLFQYEQLSQPSYWSANGIQFSSTETGQFQNGSSSSIDPTTGDPYASFLLGLVDNAAIGDNTVQTTGGRWQNYAIWVQDDWKLTPKLTVNLGLRYSIPKPFTEAHDRWSDFNPTAINPITGTPGAVQFGGFGPDSCNCHTDVKTHYLTLGPRAGFAYSLNDKTVIRSSFAMVHFNGGMLGGNGTQQGPGVLGFSSNPSFSSADGGIHPAFDIDNGFQNPVTYLGTTGNTSYVVPPFFSSTLNTGFTTTPGFQGSQGGYEYDRPETSGRSPYTEEWNLTIERQLPASMVVNLTYAGTSSHFLGLNGGVGQYSNQVSPAVYQLPGMGPLLNQQWNAVDPNTHQSYLAEAQAIDPGVGLPFPNFAGTIGQLLRPFPQYTPFGPVWNGNPDSFSNFGTASYNALQATLTRNMQNGLYLFATYAWSKEMDEGDGTIQFFEQNARSAYAWNLERSPGLSNTPQSFSFAEVYDLPIGRGKRVRVSNDALNAIVGGWTLAGAEQYSQGNPFTPVVGACTQNQYGGTTAAINAGGLNPGCYDDYNPDFHGHVNIKKIGTGNPKTDAYFDYHAFSYNATPGVEAASAHQLAPYSLGNTPRTMAFPSMHGEFYKNENVSLTKTMPLPSFFGENLNFVFRADAINIFNRAIFQNPNMNASAGAAGSFGKVTSQENSPRFLQFEGHIRF